MRTLWKLMKVVLAVALVIPVSIIVLATALGILGGLFGLAVLALKLAVMCLMVYGVFRLVSALMCGNSRRPRPNAVRELPPVDPHYEAAMRELDQELGEVRR
jgi:hypothetical protein